MVSSDSLSSFVPLVSWLVLPNILTTIVLRAVYQTQIIALPSTAQQQQHHNQVARAFVIASYLLYTIYASLFRREANFYQVLGISLDCDTEDVRRAFRKLARIYHPDKVGGGARSEAFFILLRRAHDGLVEPTKRFAYDRFGPEVMRWGSDTITEREYFSKGVTHSLSFYIINPLIFGAMNWLNGEAVFTFWRTALLVLLFILEVSLITAPASPPALVRVLLPTQTVHDLVGCLHTTFIAVNLASRHIGSLLPPLGGTMGKMRELASLEGGSAKNSEKSMQDMVQAMAKMQDLSTAVRIESARSMAHSLQPLRPPAVSSAATVQDAARDAAEAHASRSHEPRAKLRAPSKAEEAWIHLFGRRLLRAEMEAHRGQQHQAGHVAPTSAAVGGGLGSSAVAPPALSSHTAIERQPHSSTEGVHVS